MRLSSGGEEIAQRHIAEILQGLGCEVEHFTYSPRTLVMHQEFADPSLIDPAERTVVAGRWRGRGGGRSLLCFAHPDTEPVAWVERWRHPPFAAEVEHGRVYGWGVADDLLDRKSVV